MVPRWPLPSAPPRMQAPRDRGCPRERETRGQSCRSSPRRRMRMCQGSTGGVMVTRTAIEEMVMMTLLGIPSCQVEAMRSSPMSWRAMRPAMRRARRSSVRHGLTIARSAEASSGLATRPRGSWLTRGCSGMTPSDNGARPKSRIRCTSGCGGPRPSYEKRRPRRRCINGSSTIMSSRRHAARGSWRLGSRGRSEDGAEKDGTAGAPQRRCSQRGSASVRKGGTRGSHWHRGGCPPSSAGGGGAPL